MERIVDENLKVKAAAWAKREYPNDDRQRVAYIAYLAASKSRRAVLIEVARLFEQKEKLVRARDKEIRRLKQELKIARRALKINT
jgi:hypothetical protein